MDFGMRLRTKHVNFRWKDIELNYRKHQQVTNLTAIGEITKTRTDLTGDTRAFARKMFEDKGKTFENFLESICPC